MTASIVTQPVTSYATVDTAHNFTVTAGGVGPFTYLWIFDDVAYPEQSEPAFTSVIATADNSYAKVNVIVTDTSDNTSAASDIVLAVSMTAAPPEETLTRHSLVWNFDDNNFVWRDPAVEAGNDVDGYQLYDITFQTYGFTPGFQERWEDYKESAEKQATWAEATAAALQWSDTFSKGNSKELIQMVNGNLYSAEKVPNRASSLKSYYVTRTQIDFDDLVSEWTTNKIKQTKQFMFHMQSDQNFIPEGSDNTIKFYVGWANNLMEDPNWRGPVTVSLEARGSGGGYKIDYRSSGRYMAMSFDLTDSAQLAFTGGDIDVAQSAGR